MSFIHQHNTNRWQPCVSLAVKIEGRFMSTLGDKMDNARLKTQEDSEQRSKRNQRSEFQEGSDREQSTHVRSLQENQESSGRFGKGYNFL